MIERLVLPHERQVVIRPDVEQVEHLADEVAVLAGRDDERRQPARTQLDDDRSQLDRFRARAEQDADGTG